MDFIHRLHYGRLVGVPFRGYDGSYQFTPVQSKKLSFYALAGIMEEIGLLLTGWEGRIWRTGWTRWDGGGMEGPALAGDGSRSPPLAL